MGNIFENNDGLLPPQADVLASGLLSTGFNCILQMPTGSGKTWLAEKAIGETLRQGGRAIYLTPLRALASELLPKWQEQFDFYEVGIFTGDYGTSEKPYPTPFSKARLLIMTPERLDACTRNWRTHWEWIPEVDLVIVDEFHLLGDRNRGARLEGTISRLQRLNPFCRFVGLSATLGNRTELADWLQGVEYSSEWRPIPLQWRTVRYKKAKEKPRVLKEQVLLNISQGGKSLVFVQSRRRAEELSRHLKTAGLRSHHHHAGLTFEQRRDIESAFRKKRVDVLVATGTLEMGLNLPINQVILYDLQTFNGTDFIPLPTNNVWQRVGRAGRLGLDTTGEAVLLAPSWDKSINDYPQGSFEPILSGLASNLALAEQIVAEVACGLGRNPSQLESIFESSLANVQKRLPNVAKVVSEMLEAGMLQTEKSEEKIEPRLKATKLGRIAARHLLSPASLILFQRALKSEQKFSFFDILLIAASSYDCEPVLPADFEQLDDLAGQLSKERSHLLRLPPKELATILGVEGKRLLASIKMALVIRSWTRTNDLTEVSEIYGCYPFEVASLKDSLQRLLLAMAAVFKPDDSDKEDFEWADNKEITLYERISALQKMVSAGLDETSVTLTLVNGIGAKWARKLQRCGVTDVEDLALSDPEELLALSGISKKRACQWITEAEQLTKSHSALCFTEVAPFVNPSFGEWPKEVEPYRLRRALDLKVKKLGGTFRVTGGLDPHQVEWSEESCRCDCADFAKGHLCKHILATKINQGETEILRLVKILSTPSGKETSPDLFAMWLGTPRKNGSRRREV